RRTPNRAKCVLRESFCRRAHRIQRSNPLNVRQAQTHPNASTPHSLSSQSESRMHFVLLSKILDRSLADIYHHLENCASERERGLVDFRDRRARITPDVEALVGCEVARNLFLEAAIPDCLLSESKSDCAAGAELALLIDFHFGGQHMASGRNRL